MAQSSETPAQGSTPPSEPAGAPGTAPAAEQEHLEFVNRVSQLPFVQGACSDTLSFYNEKKNASQGVFQWGLQTAEDTAKCAVGYVKPVVQAIPIKPHGVIDQTLCNAVNYVEGYLPFVHKQPKEVFQDAKERANHAKGYAAVPCNAVKSLQEQSWQQVNLLMETEKGKNILGGCNKLISTAEELLQFLLPHGSKLLNYNENAERLARIIIHLADLPEKLYRPLVDRITNVYSHYSSSTSNPTSDADQSPPQPSSQDAQPMQTSQPVQQPMETSQPAQQPTQSSQQ